MGPCTAGGRGLCVRRGVRSLLRPVWMWWDPPNAVRVQGLLAGGTVAMLIGMSARARSVSGGIRRPVHGNLEQEIRAEMREKPQTS
jgi:hypothetical protein